MTIASSSIMGELAEELEIQSSALTGDWVLIGVLAFNPVHIVFDNQTSNRAIQIGNDADTVWHTFPAGEAIILDMRANHGIAANYSFRKGMSFYARGTAGLAGEYFRISYTYA